MNEGLRLEGIRKRISNFVLEADFNLEAGQRAVLIGKSGSGKTTLLRVIAGLESLDGAEDQGRIWLGSKEITNLPVQKRELGVVFQDQALFPALDLLDNVTFGLRLRGIAREEREAQALPWLRKVGLDHRVHSSVSRLSGGEAQRAAFIRALIWKPRALLLDEPFSALDPGLRSVLRSELVALHQLWPVPLILVSHDAEDFEKVGTSRWVLEELPLEVLTGVPTQIRRIQRIRVE